MKTFTKHQGFPAFTRVELVVVIAILFVLAVILVPALSRAKAKSRRITCVSHLKNIGLSFRIFATDHGSHFPQATPGKNGGSQEFGADGAAFNHFLTLSNELSVPLILVCPADTRQAAGSWPELSISNVSYFIGLHASETTPQMLLAGDRNITNGIVPRRGVLDLAPSRPTGWTHEIHLHQGNVLIADGSVQQLNDSRLREVLSNSGNSTNRILLPE